MCIAAQAPSIVRLTALGQPRLRLVEAYLAGYDDAVRDFRAYAARGRCRPDYADSKSELEAGDIALHPEPLGRRIVKRLTRARARSRGL